MYKIVNDPITDKPMQVVRSDNWTIPFAPDNTDYQKFKTDVAAGVPLEDAEGVLMTQEQVDEFLRTIP